MAEHSLSSLEYWLAHIKLSKLKSYYPLILAKFDDYLQLNKANDRDQEDSLEQEKTLTMKLTYKGKGRKKLPLKLIQRSNHTEHGELYEDLQFRILKILGQLAGHMSHYLHETSQESEQLIVWDTVQHLQFSMPFVDMKPVIYFDRFLQRIVYLSLSSTNRQTKVRSNFSFYGGIIRFECFLKNSADKGQP